MPSSRHQAATRVVKKQQQKKWRYVKTHTKLKGRVVDSLYKAQHRDDAHNGRQSSPSLRLMKGLLIIQSTQGAYSGLNNAL